MLQLYDLNHNKLAGLTNYKEYKIESGINTEDTLSFLFANSDDKYNLLQEECYIRTKDNEYIIKEINYNDDNWTEYVCKINIEGLKGTVLDRFETVEQSCSNAVNLALAGTGWTIGSCNVAKLRTVRKSNCSVYDVLKEIQSAYSCEMTFDSINKKIYIYQTMGSDKGAYFTEQLNLKKLDVQSNSYDYITRLIPIGKDGLTITTVNAGLNYIENHQYSNKAITAYWEDNRYTDSQGLLEDGIARLNYLSRPYKAYKADIYDLSAQSNYSILDYDLGDTITLLAKSKNTKEKQRIVKITIYPEEADRNTVEIANKIPSLEYLQVRFINTSDSVDTVTTSDGGLDGSKVDSIDASTQITNLDTEVARITNLTAINASITYLQTYKADITDLNSATARIGTLESTSATITQLNATNANITSLQTSKANVTDLTAATGRITTLESQTASINNLLAGNIGASNLAAGAIQAGSAVIANGAIGSAQISSLDVTKLNAGTLDTTKITIAGTNSRLKISGNRLQVFAQKADLSWYERISLGDVNADGSVYGIRVRGSDGVTVLLDETGVKREGITDGSINNAKIGSDANISGSKLDIASVVTSINGGSTTIQSSKVSLNGSTLDVQFNNLNTTVTNQGTTITSQGSSITANTNAIALKLDTTTFNSYKTTNDGNITSINSSISSQGSSITALQGQITTKVTQTDVTNYVVSRGQNLVTNGTGSLGNNTNFTGLTYDGSDSYFSKGSFKTAVQTSKFNDELIPVDVSKTYRLTAWAKCNPTVNSNHYIGVSEYDCDGNQITSVMHMYVATSLSTLTQDLNPGDTVVHLDNVTGWATSGTQNYQRTLIFWDYKNAAGYLYPVKTYSRNVTAYDMWADGSIDTVGKTITLRAPWSGAKKVAGTQLSQGSAGTTYKYIACNAVNVPTTWTNYTGTIGGVDNTGNNDSTKFAQGTAYVKIVILPNWTALGGTLWLSNISFNVDLASQVALDSVTTRVTNTETSITSLNNSIVLKANQSDLTTTNANVTTAQNTANAKRRVFTAQPTTPYDVGDLWVGTTSNGNNMVCTTARASGSYTAGDWSQDSVTQRMTTAESSITVNANNIALKVSSNGVIAAINASAEGISINASKINLTGYVTVTNLSTPGSVTINGGNIVGGSLTLGGNNNANGVEYLKDGSGNNILVLSKDGILAKDSSIQVMSAVPDLTTYGQVPGESRVILKSSQVKALYVAPSSGSTMTAILDSQAGLQLNGAGGAGTTGYTMNIGPGTFGTYYSRMTVQSGLEFFTLDKNAIQLSIGNDGAITTNGTIITKGSEVWSANNSPSSLNPGGYGYQKFPSGLMMQWGTITVGISTGNGETILNFPTSFPSHVDSFVATVNYMDGGQTYAFYWTVSTDIISVSQGRVRVRNNVNSWGSTVLVSWMAFGK